MKFVALALLAIVSIKAQASQDPRFTYLNAEAAYNAAAVPSTAQLTANSWMLIGKASASSMPQGTDGYWTDGKQPGQVGFYQEYLTLSNAADAFGHATQTAQETYYGAETGNLYFTINYTYTVDADAANVVELTRHPKTTQSCRVSNALLLCKITYNNGCREERRGLSDGQAAMYLGYSAVTP